MKPWGERNGYALYRCISCTHKFADLSSREEYPDDPRSFLEKITNGLMSSDEQYYDHLVAGESIGKGTSITAGHVLDICRQNAGNFVGNWLDIGCGSGYLLSLVQNAGFDAIGIEPGGWGQIAAKQKKLHVVQGFLATDTFPQRFDVVSATDVVEHVPNPVEFLRLMAEYVVPSGYIIISIPFADSVESKVLGIRWNMVEPPTHCQFFSMRSLRLAMQCAGLEMVCWRQFNLRNLRGLSRYKSLRHLVDALLPGPQMVCLMQKRRQA